MRKKILYIHHGSAKGGAPRSLSMLINEIDTSRYDPYVVFGIDRENNSRLFESVAAKALYVKGVGPWHGSTVSGISLSTFIWNHIFTIFTKLKLKEVLRNVKPDLVHLNSTSLCFAAKEVKKYDHGIPVICHVREPLLEGHWGNILRKNCDKYVDQFIAIEKYDADSLHTRKPVEIINNFVDFSVYYRREKSNCLKKELKLKQEDKILLFLARVVSVNGALPMLTALEPLLNKREDIHLCIVGASDALDSYEKSVAEIADKHNNVHLLSFRSDVTQVIASSDVMLVPFQQPHFARSVIEAGAMGVPSIVSNIGGLDELVIDGETGYLFDYKTFDGFSELCERLIDDDALREKLGDNAEKLSHERFDAVKNANQTFAVYEKCLYVDAVK